jgi:phospholipid/cholesterol/gamma-HCH transport system substrate-binding protein
MRLETGIGSLTAYEVTVGLRRADGLNVGDDVRLSGVKIGTVADLALNSRTYTVTARLRIRSDIRIPTDSALRVAPDLTGGGANLSVTPGKSHEMIPDGGVVERLSRNISMSEAGTSFI